MEKKKLVFVDIYNSGPDYLDPIFDENKVELCEVFTLNGEGGVKLSDIVDYAGWDYAVVTYMPNRFEQVRKLVTELGVTPQQTIYVSHDGLLCDNYQEIKKILKASFANALEFNFKSKEYKSKIRGDYVALTVDGLSYVNKSSDDTIMKAMYIWGCNFSKDTIDDFYKVAKEKFCFTDEQEIFCDIGANIGTSSIYFKKKLDESVKILAFEPSKTTYKLLKVNMLLNDIDENDQILANCALSDERGTMKFEYDPANPGGSSLMAGKVENAQVEQVEVITFDDYLEENEIDIKTIKYLWIDVEGFEPAFFRGAQKTLNKINVPIITEFSPELYIQEGQFEEYVQFLCGMYRSFIIIQEDGHSEHDINELYDYGKLDCQVDIMFIK